MKRLIPAVLALFALSAFADQTTGGVNWIEPLGYTKPHFTPISVPSEASTPNKYWIDLTSGSGATCSNVSPCKSLSSVSGKAGTTGGPAYIYVKGIGPFGNPTLYGSVGNEVVIKPWDDNTSATFTGRNNLVSQLQNIVIDGGMNLGFRFQSDSGGQFDPSLYFNASGATTHQNIKIARSQWHVPGMGEWVAQWGQYTDLYFINNEFHADGSTDTGNQHHMYFSGASNYGTSSGLYILNNIFRSTPGEAIEFRMFQTVTGVTIDGNAFHDVGKGTCSNSWKCRSAITFVDGQTSGARIANAKFSNNLVWDTGEGIMRCWASSSVLVYNNTVYLWGQGTPQNGNYGTWAFFGYQADGNCTPVNNIIYSGGGKSQNGSTLIPFDNSSGIASGASNNMCATGQSCGANAQPWSSTTAQSINPNISSFMFMNSSSTALGNGINTAGTPDYISNPRPSSSGWDIGAIGGSASTNIQAPTNLRVQ